MTGDARLLVHGATAYPTSAASARVRVHNYTPFLRAHGIEFEHVPMVSEEEYALLISAAAPMRKAFVLARSGVRAASVRRLHGLLLVHRLLLLTPVPLLDPPPRLDIYDFDDALLVGSATAANRRFQWTKQERRRAIACMRRARLVITANATLATDAQPYARRVEVVPSCVDPDAQPMREHAEHETVTVGWIGSHSTVGYLEPLLPILRRLNERGVSLRLVVVGGDTGLREAWLEHRPWSLGTQARDLSGFDIGVMPLPDTPWARGKSGYKLLQYFAAGVPAVASPVGVNADLLAGGQGLAANTESDWEAALLALHADATERRERGLIARRFVEEHFSYQRWAPEVASLFRGLAVA